MQRRTTLHNWPQPTQQKTNDGDAGDDDGDDAADIALKWPQPPYKCGPNPPLEKSDFFSGSPPLDLIYHANAETAAPNTSKEEKTQLGYPSFCDLHLFVWCFCFWGTPQGKVPTQCMYHSCLRGRGQCGVRRYFICMCIYIYVYEM